MGVSGCPECERAHVGVTKPAVARFTVGGSRV